MSALFPASSTLQSGKVSTSREDTRTRRQTEAMCTRRTAGAKYTKQYLHTFVPGEGKGVDTKRSLFAYCFMRKWLRSCFCCFARRSYKEAHSKVNCQGNDSSSFG